MLDVALFREKPEWVKEQIAKLNDPVALSRVDEVVAIDKRRRALIQEAETLQAMRNRLNKAVGQLRGNKQLAPELAQQRAAAAVNALQSADYEYAEALLLGKQDAPANTSTEDALTALSDALRTLGERQTALANEADAADKQLRDELLFIPNLPHETVPVAPDDSHNIAWTPEGEQRHFDFTPKAHWDLGVELDMIDFERGVKLSGSRFYVLKGWGARLQRALAAFFLDMARQKGFTEVYVPFLVYEGMMEGAGQFPKFKDVVYNDPDADLYLLPTAEVAITNLHRDEILSEEQLPLYYVAQTPCFRREKTSAGRDVRGIKRVHQFEKVEMYKFTTPETSYQELETLVEAACDIARALKIPHRRLEIVTGDLGFSATKKYDVEMWAPGCEEWLEVSSCSNTESFQARRAMVRYYPKDTKKAQYVHTLNGSGLALPRVIIAIMENYQQADGSIIIPEVLRPYLGGESVIRKS